MQISGNAAQELVTRISESGHFDDINLVVAYENKIKPTPLDKPIVTKVPLHLKQVKLLKLIAEQFT